MKCRIWTLVTLSISYEGNNYTTNAFFKYIYIYSIGPVGRVFANSPRHLGSQVESYQRLKKWYLMPPYLTLSIIRYGSRLKWSIPGKGLAPSPTPWWSCYWKGALQISLDYSHQLYFIYIYISLFSSVYKLQVYIFFPCGWHRSFGIRTTYVKHDRENVKLRKLCD